MKQVELLAPASSLEVLKVAIIYGADAVYIGGDAFGLRANAKNFSLEEMQEAIAFAHQNKAKVYITANIIAHNEDLEGIRTYFKKLKKIKPDALIISDLGVFNIAKEICPEIDIHISTQANATNYETFNMWYNLGASRVVGARELSLKEIADIKKYIGDKEIEAFVHGAMCISYSGRCLLSNYFTHRSANLGDCSHPCRWKYYVVEETRPNEYLPIWENERGTYIFNSKDLCMIDHLDDLIASGVTSLKIEGRMKSALYVATVVKAYKEALNLYYQDKELYNNNKELYKKTIYNCTYREFTTGFYYGKADETSQIYDENTYNKGYTYLGTVLGIKNGMYKIIQHNKFSCGEYIEIMTPTKDNIKAKVNKIINHEGEEVTVANCGTEVLLVGLDIPLNLFDILKKKADDNEN
jgi:putative protease